MTEIDLNKVRLPARVKLRDGSEGVIHFRTSRDCDFPFVGECYSISEVSAVDGHDMWTEDGRFSIHREDSRDIIAIIQEGVTFPPADAPQPAPAVVDLRKEKLPVEARQRDGEQVTITKNLSLGWFEVLFGGGKRIVRADGTHPDRSDFDIVEIIRDAAPALPFGLRAEDGWKLHDGGECPVGRNTLVQVYLRLARRDDGTARSFRWKYIDTSNEAYDIIVYRVIKEAPQHAPDEAPADHIADAGKMIEPTYLEQLRDQFAAAAISGAWANEADKETAEWAYRFADAMLAARAASKVGGEA